MGTYIKPGLWEVRRKALRGELSLDDFIQTAVTIAINNALNGLSASQQQVDDGLISGKFLTPQTYGGSVPLLPDIIQSVAGSPYYEAVQTYAQGQGITVPDAEDAYAIDNYLLGLDADGLLSDTETLNIYGFGSVQFGTLNLVDPNTFRHTSPNIASVDFTRGGVKSDQTSGSYFNTNYAVNQRAGIEGERHPPEHHLDAS